jgi:DNA-directed RNA polymerase subunit L
MGRAIEAIEKDLQSLENQCKALAESLQKADSNYLELLAQGLHQQLIMTAYYLCTQVYAEFFLQLSFSQTEQVQNSLKKAVKDLKNELESLQENCQTTLEFKDPIHLVDWQKNLENNISNSLNVASRTANQILHQAGIFPQQAPASLIELATEIDTLNDAIASAPNLVNIMVQNPEIPENGAPIITSIKAIQLRLTDIEFSNSQIMGARHHIRHLLSQLVNLQREYQQKQGEWLIVEAENAWRRSWFDEDK